MTVATTKRQTPHRPWTDEEMGVLTSHESLTSRELGEILGRSENSIQRVREKLASGWTRKVNWWTPDEDEVIQSVAGMTLNATQLAKMLPGRSVAAARLRRKELGLGRGRAPVQVNPAHPGHRRIIAKTCTRCGVLFPGEKFKIQKGRKSSYCSWCHNDLDKARDVVRPRRVDAPRRAEVRSRWRNAMRAITTPNATRSGFPYLESDFKVIDDPTLTVLGKALKLNRTWVAIRDIAHQRGAKNAGKSAGDRSNAAWSIDNPNIDRIDEITASIKQEFIDAGVQIPAWDWDDEDLLVAA